MMCSVLGLCLTLIDVLDQSFVLEAADHRERERERERETSTHSIFKVSP